MTASSTAHKGPLSAVPFVVLVRASLLKKERTLHGSRGFPCAVHFHTGILMGAWCPNALLSI